MTSNHSSAYASNVVLDLEFTPAGHAGRAQRLTDEIIEVGTVKLEEAANWCGIPFEANRAHRALYDAQMTAELFRMMLAGDLATQREGMSSQVKSPSDEKPLLSTLGGSCGGLAELLASLRAQELACA